MIYKEKVIDKLLLNNNVIYISSSNLNLEYYYYTFIEKNKKLEKYIYFFDDIDNDENKSEIAIKILEILKSNEKKYIFMHFNVALNLFFQEIKYKTYEKGKKYDLKELEEFLNENYNKSYIVNNKNEYSIKREIIDVFPINLNIPVRLVFFDNELENIKEFDIETQKSIKNIDSINIYMNKKIEKGKFFIDYIIENKLNFNIYLENKEYIDVKIDDLIYFDKIKEYEKILNNSTLLEVGKNKEEIYSYNKKVKNTKRNILKIDEIKTGDYIIHLNYGIGIYEDIVEMYGKEYILLKYADQDKLYVPIEKIDRLEKYYNQDKPKIYNLGTRVFKNRLKKIEEKISEFIDELIEIQSYRKENKGFFYEEDTILQKQFEDEFIYNLTEDQEKAIRDIKEDMQSFKIMDRLICADVGYGKTELAMRAAFKAVDNSKQVILLAPTTVLANQHYERFKERFKNFPINIFCLSRLNNKKEIDNIKVNIENGNIDILIGTHSVLNENLKFKNLSLLIIDEEQKFGVKQKEILKTRYTNIDVLSTTATPIPRTLNMAMMGLRDISVIETAPNDRLVVKTKVIEENEENIKKIILRELSRDGQIFYITNNVVKMKEKKEYLKKFLPKYVNVEYINGKLSPKEIKNKIEDFEKGKFDILIASTIIENGIDIPNANTIIIEKFEDLGLSQIYQLRGRVGRSSRQGYCYLLKKQFYSTKKGQKKIESMENIENIKGLELALDDLKIRGAGEILGKKQHGIIENFGYDIYIKMINEKIKEKKYNIKPINTEIILERKYKIPQEYILGFERLKMYKRILNCDKIVEVDELKKEILDRFGKIPFEVENLLFYSKLKIYAKKNEIYKIEEKNNKFELYISTQNVKDMILLEEEEIKKRIGRL